MKRVKGRCDIQTLTKRENNHLKVFGLILFGTLLITTALEGFLLVNNLAFGGVGGLSLIFERLLGLDEGSRRIIFWGISFSLLVMAGHKRGEIFMYKTFCAFSMVSFGFPTFVTWLEATFNLRPLAVFGGLPLALSAIIGGVILGMGVVCIIRAGGSTSGPDTFAYVIIPRLKKHLNKKDRHITDQTLLPIIMIIFDLIVYTGGILIFGLSVWQGIFTIITLPLTIRVLLNYLENKEVDNQLATTQKAEHLT